MNWWRPRCESGVDALDAVPGVEPLGRSRRAASDAGSFAALFSCDVATLASEHEALAQECFGAVAVIVRYASIDEALEAISSLEPALTFSVHVVDDDPDGAALMRAGVAKAGRVLVNGFPTGVGVSWSMHHGGPHPAATSSLHTSVGATALRRWLRPVCYQGVPTAWLPEALRDDNPLGIAQRVDGVLRPASA